MTVVNQALKYYVKFLDSIVHLELYIITLGARCNVLSRSLHLQSFIPEN